MKKIIYLVMFIFLISNVYSLSEYKSLSLNTKIEFGSKIVYKDVNSVIDFIDINLTLFPRENYRQKVTSFDTESVPLSSINIKDNYINYIWYDFKDENLKIKLDSSVITNMFTKKVSKSIGFPLDVSDDMKIYLKEGVKTDITDEIREKANELVAGESDLYFAVFKIAEWVKEEVPYDLNTLTEDAVQSSSWVFRNRQGVCDEITGLFISLLRSVGVPVRFVSGTVYTETNGWGNHGWAEVYFSDYGWIPFDVTFGQYGWVDSTHVVLDNALDTSDSSLRYSWKAYEVDFEVEDIKIETTLIEKGDELEELVKLDIKVLENDVSGGSRVPIQVIVENLQSYYVSSSVYFVKSPKLINGNVKQILLKPLEKRSLFWVAKLPEDLDKKYIYTAMLEVKDSFGSSSENKLKYSDEGKFVSLGDANSIISSLVEEEEKLYSGGLNFECKTDKEFYYSYENAFVNCGLINKGNIKLMNVEFCFENCEKFDLSILEERKFNFELSSLNEEKKVSMKYNNKLEQEIIDINLLENPDLEIKSVDYNSEILYYGEGEVSLILISKSLCNDLKIFGKNLGNLDGEKEFKLNLFGKDFVNVDEMEVKCNDLNGREYSVVKDVEITVVEIPFYVKIWLWFLELF